MSCPLNRHSDVRRQTTGGMLIGREMQMNEAVRVVSAKAVDWPIGGSLRPRHTLGEITAYQVPEVDGH